MRWREGFAPTSWLHLRASGCADRQSDGDLFVDATWWKPTTADGAITDDDDGKCLGGSSGRVAGSWERRHRFACFSRQHFHSKSKCDELQVVGSRPCLHWPHSPAGNAVSWVYANAEHCVQRQSQLIRIRGPTLAERTGNAAATADRGKSKHGGGERRERGLPRCQSSQPDPPLAAQATTSSPSN